jgi:hypothetical protein
MKTIIQYRFIPIFFALFSTLASAQNHVFTQTITKNYLVGNKAVTVNAEKARIYLSESKSNKLELELQFISKNTTKESAKAQLAFFKHVFTNRKKEILLRNYILIPEEEELTGSIEAIYTLKIPSGKNIYITNSLGEINMENYHGNIDVVMKYGNINGKNIHGDINIDSHIGDLILKNCSLNAKISSAYVSHTFNLCKGNFFLEAKLGSVQFVLNKNLGKLDIEANGTEITLINKECTPFNLNLDTTFGNIMVSKCVLSKPDFILEDSRSDNTDKKGFSYYNKDISRLIRVKNKYSNISIL